MRLGIDEAVLRADARRSASFDPLGLSQSGAPVPRFDPTPIPGVAVPQQARRRPGFGARLLNALARMDRDFRAIQESRARVQLARVNAAINTCETLAKFKEPVQRQAMIPVVRNLLEIADISVNERMFDTLASTEGAAGKIGAYIKRRFGPKADEVWDAVSGIEDPTKQLEAIDELYTAEVEGALPPLQRELAADARRAGATGPIRLDLFADEVRESLEGDPVKADAFNRLVTDQKFAWRWARLGVEPGSVRLRGLEAAATRASDKPMDFGDTLESIARECGGRTPPRPSTRPRRITSRLARP